MSYRNTCAVVLAAGRSSRFLGSKSKLLTKMCGLEMILFSLKALEGLGISSTFVLGHQRDVLSELIGKHAAGKVNFAHQREQLGTGHALACSEGFWGSEHVFALNGDMPLVGPRLIGQLIDEHQASRAVMSFVAFKAVDPAKYGRVFWTPGRVKIIEYKDCSEIERENNLVNAGLYLFEKEFLQKSSQKISNKNASGEFYLTDLVEIASQQGLGVNVVRAPSHEVLGINTVAEFLEAEATMRTQILTRHMEAGVDFAAPASTLIDFEAQIGRGTFIGGNVSVLGRSQVGQDCYIGTNSVIDSSVLDRGAKILENCLIKGYTVSEGAQVSAFERLMAKNIESKESQLG